MAKREKRKRRREGRREVSRGKKPARVAAPTWSPGRAPIVGLAIAVIAAVAFWNSMHDTLVHDDKFFVPLPAAVSSDPWSVFSTHAWAHTGMPSNLYRPILMLCLLADGWIGGGAVGAFRWSSIGLHVVASVLVYAVALAVLGRIRAPNPDRDHNAGWAGCATAIFAVHPIHTEAVDSIFNRSETLACVFVLLGLWAIVRVPKPHPSAWALACVAFFFALLSKESAIAFPVLAALLVWLVSEERGARARIRELAPMLAFIVPLVLYLWLRTRALGGLVGEVPVYMENATPPTPFDRIERSLAIIVQSMRMVVFPHPLRATYDDAAVPSLWVIGAVAVALGGLVVRERKRDGIALTIAVGFFVLALLPAARPVGGGDQLLTSGERFVYLPSVGPAIALALVLRTAATRWGPMAAVAPTVLLGLVFLVRSWTRNAEWTSDLTLWQAEHASAPESADALRLLTVALLDRGRNSEVADLCDVQMPLHPEAAKLALHCGAAYHRLKRLDEAERAYLRAAESPTMRGMPHSNLARLYLMMKRPVDAEKQADLAIAAEYTDALKHVRRAFKLTLLYSRDVTRLREAEAELVRALEMQPGMREAEGRLDEVRRKIAKLERGGQRR